MTIFVGLDEKEVDRDYLGLCEGDHMPADVRNEVLSPSQGMVDCACVSVVGASLKPQTRN